MSHQPPADSTAEAGGVDEPQAIYGRHPVAELLRARRRRVRRLLVAEGAQARGVLGEVLREAAARGIPRDQVSRSRLNAYGAPHGGLVALADPYPYVQLDDILERAAELGEPPLVLLLDELQDPQNLGTLLRTTEAVGAHGVVLARHRGVGVSEAVVASSAGASEHLLIARANLAQAMQWLRRAGVWILGLERSPAAQPLDQLELSGPLGVVVGSEGAGLRRLVRETCDFLGYLPMRGRIAALNAAVAGSIALYSIWSRRGYRGAEPPAGRRIDAP
jgi:23S rRNA (guanosine2251-2'-O)-methyltransferase